MIRKKYVCCTDDQCDKLNLDGKRCRHSIPHRRVAGCDIGCKKKGFTPVCFPCSEIAKEGEG